MLQAAESLDYILDAILLDLGDVLVYLIDSIWVTACSLLLGHRVEDEDERTIAMLPSRLQRRHQWLLRTGILAKEIVTDRQRELTLWRSYYCELLAGFSPSSPPRRRQEAVEYLADATVRPDSFACFDDVVTSLRVWADHGTKLALISNSSPSGRDILQARDLDRWFQVILLSNELGYAKPSYEIYMRAVEQLAVTGQRALFIDDRAQFLTLKGGLPLPVHAALIDRGYANLERWKGPTVHSLEELTSALGCAQSLACRLPKANLGRVAA